MWRRLSGYSGTPLPEEARDQGGSARRGGVRTRRLRARRSGRCPPGCRLRRQARGRCDVVVFFVTRRAELARRFPAFVRALEPDGGLWVAWPKKTSGVATDLVFDAVQEVGLDAGLVDNKVCAIDDTWSGLRFVRTASTDRVAGQGRRTADVRSVRVGVVAAAARGALRRRRGRASSARARLQRDAPGEVPDRPRAPGRPAQRCSRWCAGASCPRGPRPRRSATSMINARAETVTEKPAYQRASRARRCIVPADALLRVAAVEERVDEAPPKQPYLVHRRDGEPHGVRRALGDLARPAVADDDDPDAWVRSCVDRHHRRQRAARADPHRMPVMLAETRWDTGSIPTTDDVGALEAMLQPAPDDWLEV